MIKAFLALAFVSLLFVLPGRAFEWGTATYNGRDYVTLQSFCAFYNFGYQNPAGNDYFTSRNSQHTVRLKLGTSDLYLDGVHYVMSFPVEAADRDWLVSRMDVIKLFEPVLRPTEISGRHSIRGVVIDAGHGGADNGATSRLGAEKYYALDTAYRLQALLHDAGLRTVLTRSNDVFVDLYERAHIASLYPDYAFVSIHFNSATPEARGLETYCLSPRGAASTSSAYLTRSDIQKLPGNDYDPSNILLASMVHTQIVHLNPGDASADRGVKRARFVVIKQNVLPAILVEGGFVSNRMEAARINQASYRQTLAEDIARGVIRFVDVMGGRRVSLPDETISNEGAPPPRAIPVVAPAPSGLARESRSVGAAPHAAPLKMTSSGPSAAKIKKSSRKSKKVAKTAKPSTAPELLTSKPSGPGALRDDAESDKPAGSGSSLNLSEPSTPVPSPGADKAPPEPDEPPTVNIYPTTPKDSAGSGSSSSSGGATSKSSSGEGTGSGTSTSQP